eukprot:TRINITY_DN76230_c0_g1_i1.p1 TRINITY_DN76230_c0_g1~~TRINITY_DN76230_c0_g1_i1.p1  ORF type:complete len:570 (+),score=93.08 TRINITY_DN76230_c0_g1_i1:66-1775(+)
MPPDLQYHGDRNQAPLMCLELPAAAADAELPAWSAAASCPPGSSRRRFRRRMASAAAATRCRGAVAAALALSLLSRGVSATPGGFATLRVEDLSHVVPGSWATAQSVPGSATSLPAALAAMPQWQALAGACMSPAAGQASSDLLEMWLLGRWMPEDRPDQVELSVSLQTTFSQLKHCRVDPAAEGSLRVFLDRAWVLGLRVAIGLPDKLFFDPATGCIATEQFDCHNVVRAHYHDILESELTEDGHYHPALELILLTGARTDVAFLQRCEALGMACSEREYLKLVVSAWDGLLKAEREFGVDERHVRISVPFSAAAVSQASASIEDSCYQMRAPGGCAGPNMMRKLWAAVQDYRLASVIVVQPVYRLGTTLEYLRSLCGYGKDLVSIRSSDHVKFLRDEVVAAAGIDMTREEGIPLAYDYPLMNRYFDLRNMTRDVTSIFHELWSLGMSGDFHTDQTSSEHWGKDEHMAGFGWGRSQIDAGIADWGHHHSVQAVICEDLNGVGYAVHNDVEESRANRWAHSFIAPEASEDITHALRAFYGFTSPTEAVFPAYVFHVSPDPPPRLGVLYD